MKLREFFILGTLAVPHLVEASNLGPFADLGIIGTGLMSVGYLFGGSAVVWSGAHTVSAYRSRDLEGMGAVWGWAAATLIGAILVSTVIPNYVGQIVALGATP